MMLFLGKNAPRLFKSKTTDNFHRTRAILKANWRGKWRFFFRWSTQNSRLTLFQKKIWREQKDGKFWNSFIECSSVPLTLLIHPILLSFSFEFLSCSLDSLHAQHSTKNLCTSEGLKYEWIDSWAAQIQAQNHFMCTQKKCKISFFCSILRGWY